MYQAKCNIKKKKKKIALDSVWADEYICAQVFEDT